MSEIVLFNLGFVFNFEFCYQVTISHKFCEMIVYGSWWNISQNLVTKHKIKNTHTSELLLHIFQTASPFSRVYSNTEE